MSSFKSFDESLFREFKSSTKEGLNNIAADNEEIDKIEFEVSQSREKVELRVDYSDFSNHIFFGSAYSAVNFALSRILNDYPWDGELKEKNEWSRINSGFENYFFDVYPKQQGHLFLVTGSSDSWVELDDHEYKLRIGTGSFAVDCVIYPYDNIGDGDDFKTIISFLEPDENDGFAIYFSGSKMLNFLIASGSSQSELSTSFDSYMSGAKALTFVYDHPAQKQIIYLDGEALLSKSTLDKINYGGIEVPSRKLYIGAMSASTTQGGFGSFYTGSIDDVRVWVGPVRSSELIKRNYYRPVHANISGGLKLYYKFNETEEIFPNVIDYSGHELHGEFTGAATFSTNAISGTLGSWFKDFGDPIFALNNTRVSASLTDQRNSGSLYDKENRNYIFSLVPSFFIDEGQDHEEMQRFLLLVARHYDRLKLYVQHLANVYNLDQGEYDNVPDDLIGLVAQHYGMDLGNVYEGASALEYLFGENVVPSGSLGESIKTIKNQLRRNLLNNLIYIIKTKSVRESLGSSLRSLGLEESVININEYSVFSGGITTSRTPRSVERRVLYFTASSNVNLTTSVYSDTEDRTIEVRALFNTASTDLTTSIFTIASGASGDLIFYLDVERENLTAANAVVKLYNSSSVVSSSLLSLFDNQWINFAATRDIANSSFSLYVGKLDRDEVTISESVSLAPSPFDNPGVGTITTASLGSRDSIKFEGHMQEFRAWNIKLSSSTLINHTRDFESLEVVDFNNDIDSLVVHLKLNDFTGSDTGQVMAHDYVQGATGSSYVGLSSSAVFNFPGKYIDKLDPSYSYDIGINNDKIRIRDRDNFTVNDVIRDIPYLSVDMSPVVSLNREIIRWFGDLEKFNNIIGKPYLRYREEIDTLNDYRYNFFNSKIDEKTDFDAYLNLLKWFDSNFTFFLKQLIPLDLISTLSNFVVESHLLEFNQVPRVFPYKKGDSSLNIEGSVSAESGITVALTAQDVTFGDPGRFGASVSASADLTTRENIFDFSSSLTGGLGVNFQRLEERKVFNDFLTGTVAPGFGNSWYETDITGANYLKNVLNVDSTFHISGVHAPGEPAGNNSLYLSASYGKPENIHYTGALNGVMDQRWLWYRKAALGDRIAPQHDFGIGYGGVWGQLWSVNNKSRIGLPDFARITAYPFEFGIGGGTTEFFVEQQPVVKVREETENTKTFVLWPNIDAFEPVIVKMRGVDGVARTTGSIVPVNPPKSSAELTVELADSFGDRINIEGFRHLDIAITGKRLVPEIGNGTSIKFVFEFQFFNKDTPADNDFEGAFSSSFKQDGEISVAAGSLSKYKTKKVTHEYSVEKIPSSLSGPYSFVSHIERELPKAKYMRVHVRIEFPTVTTRADYKILIKGTLYKETTTTQEKILNIRSV